MDDSKLQANNDDTIRALQRNESKVEALTDSMRELKRAVEELIDRVDADIDTLRVKSEGIAVTAAAVTDIQRRVTVAETKIEALAVDNAKLETKLENTMIEKSKLETKLEAVQIRVWLASGGMGVLVWIASRLFH